MSFRQGARQFFERRGAPTPPLPYDAEVEWLEGTGTQYIETGTYPGDNRLIKCRFAASIIQRQLNYFPFWRIQGRTGIGMFQTSANPARWVMAYTPLTINPISTMPDENWHSIELYRDSSSQYLTLDDVTEGISQSPAASISQGQILLFANAPANGGLPSSVGKGKISSFSVYDTSTNQNLCDFVSVRFTNELGQSEGAMYDRVSGQLFRNAGTGTFTWGEKQ